MAKIALSAEIPRFSWEFRPPKNIFRTLENGHSIRHQSIPPLSAGRFCVVHCETMKFLRPSPLEIEGCKSVKDFPVFAYLYPCLEGAFKRCAEICACPKKPVSNPPEGSLDADGTERLIFCELIECEVSNVLGTLSGKSALKVRMESSNPPSEQSRLPLSQTPSFPVWI